MLKIEIIGHLGGDAELKQNDRGQFVVFSVYHSDRWVDKSSGQVVEEVTRCSCTINGNLGNLLQYMKQGFRVFVRGNASMRTYLGQDNQWHSGLNVQVTELEPCFEKKAPINPADDCRPL